MRKKELPQKALPREDRKRQIVLAFAVLMQSTPEGEPVFMTVATIARKLQLSPSTKLREMILEMVIEGELLFRDEPIPGIAKFRRLYFPNPEHFKRPKPVYHGQGRAIKINSKQGSFLAEVGL